MTTPPSARPEARSLVLPSRLESIDEGRRWTARLAEAAGVGADDVASLELALTEAFSNIVRHAYDGDPGQEVGLTLTIAERYVELALRDHGRAFDEAAYEPPDPDHPGEGGYGVQLIADVMDEVSRTPLDSGGTLLKLRKFR